MSPEILYNVIAVRYLSETRNPTSYSSQFSAGIPMLLVVLCQFESPTEPNPLENGDGVDCEYISPEVYFGKDYLS